MWVHVLRNAAIPIVTNILSASGALAALPPRALLGIPGIGAR